MSDRPTRPPRTGSARHRQARAALLCALTFFLGFQAALTVAMERWRPELRDPEYGYRLAHLRNLLAKHPGRPLVLALGSSRTQLGFRPAALTWAAADGAPPPVAFNGALVGSHEAVS